MGNDPERFDRLERLWHAEAPETGWGMEVRTGTDPAWTAMPPPTSRPVDIPHAGHPDHRVWTAVQGPLPPGQPFDYRVLKNGTVAFEQEGAKARTAPGPAQRVVVRQLGETGEVLDAFTLTK
jgi:hypothetical protein